MKSKTILRREWRGIYERSYAETRFDLPAGRGIAGLLAMDRADDFSVRFGSGRRQITGKGYSWLQLALEGEQVWATVMFDQQGRIFECYFDITSENALLPDGGSHFQDLYLDVVICPDSNDTYCYDEDELLAAFRSGEITQAQMEGAFAARERLLSSLARHRDEFFAQCVRLQDALAPLLKPAAL